MRLHLQNCSDVKYLRVKSITEVYSISYISQYIPLRDRHKISKPFWNSCSSFQRFIFFSMYPQFIFLSTYSTKNIILCKSQSTILAASSPVYYIAPLDRHALPFQPPSSSDIWQLISSPLAASSPSHYQATFSHLQSNVAFLPSFLSVHNLPSISSFLHPCTTEENLLCLMVPVA